MAPKAGSIFRDPAPGEASREIFGLVAPVGRDERALDWTHGGSLTRALAATGAQVVCSSPADDPARLEDASFDLVALEADPIAAGHAIGVGHFEEQLDEACRVLRSDGRLRRFAPGSPGGKGRRSTDLRERPGRSTPRARIFLTRGPV